MLSSVSLTAPLAAKKMITSFLMCILLAASCLLLVIHAPSFCANAQVVAAATCGAASAPYEHTAVDLETNGCGAMEPDTSMGFLHTCDPNVAAAIPNTIPVSIKNLTGTSNYMMGRCALTQVRTIDLAGFTDIGNVQYVLTMTSLDPSTSIVTNGVASGASLYARSNSSGVEQWQPLGQLRHNINVNVMPTDPGVDADTPLPRGQGTGNRFPYPFNGKAFCNDTFSFQAWYVGNGLGPITQLQFRSPHANLHIHAVSATNCSAAFSPALGDRPTLFVNATTVQVGGSYGVSTSTQSSESACDVLCRLNAGACTYFVYDPATSTCAISNNMLGFRGGTAATAEPQVLGFRPGAASVPTTRRATPYDGTVFAGDADQQAKLTRPDLGSASSGGAFLYVRTTAETAEIINAQFHELHGYSLSVAQTTLGTSILSAFSTSSTQTLVDAYGGGLLYPFSGMTAGQDNACGTWLNSVPAVLPSASATSEKRAVYLAAPPAPLLTCAASGTVSELGSALLLKYTGTAVGSRFAPLTYKYASVSASGVTAAVLAEKHSVAESAVSPTLTTIDAAGGKLDTYTTTGSSTTLVTTAPNWMFVDSDNVFRSASVLCQMHGSVGYKVFENSSATSPVAGSEYDCGPFASREEIMTACEKDSSCAGFSLTVAAGTESAGCLYNGSLVPTTHGLNVTSTMFVKTTQLYQCEIPTLKATRVTVKVSDALPNSQFQLIGSTSGNVISTCTTSALGTPATATEVCYKFLDCYVGDVDAAEEKLIVKLLPGAAKQSKCSEFAATVLVSFEESSVEFSPAPSCITNLGASGGCSAVTGSLAPPCSASLTSKLAQSGLDYNTTSQCAISNAGSSRDAVVEYSVSNNPANVFVVADLSGMDEAHRRTGAVVVKARTSQNNDYLLGYIFQKDTASKQLFSLALGRVPYPAASFCNNSDVDVHNSNLVQTAAFAIPAAARSEGVASVRISGTSGTRIVRVASLAPSCAGYPVFAQTADTTFAQVTRDVTVPSSSVISTTTEPHMQACAESCAANGGSCRSWLLTINSGGTSGSCQLYNSVKFVSVPASVTSTATAFGTLQIGAGTNRWPGFSYKTAAAASGTKSAVMFALDPSLGRNSIVLGMSDVTALHVSLSDSNVQASGAFIGHSSGLGAAACGGAASPFQPGSTGAGCDIGLLQCQPLATNGDAISSLLFVSPIDSGGSSTFGSSDASCSTLTGQGAPAIWGRVDVEGSVSTTAYSVLSILSAAATFTAAPNTFADEVSTGKVDGTNVQLGRQQPTDTAGFKATGKNTINAPHNAFVCDISDLYAFEGMLKTGAGGGEYGCNSVPNAATAMKKCIDDGKDCAGFTTDANAGTPLCFYGTAPSTSGSVSGRTFWKKPSYAPSCQFTVSTPGVVDIKTTLRHMGLDEGEVVIKLDGTVVKRCGDMQPSYLGSADRTSTIPQDFAECDTYRTCYRGPLFAVSGSTLEITFRRFKLTNDRKGCRTAYSALVTFTPTPGADYPQIYTGAGKALFMRHYLRVPSTTSAVTINGWGMDKYMVFAMQDRYDCGACGITSPTEFFKIELDDTPAALRRCGGQAQFYGSTNGLDGTCTRYKPCGFPTSTDNIPVTLPVTNGGKKLVITHTDTATIGAASCFSSVTDRYYLVMTNGVSLGGQQGATDFRMNIVVQAPSGTENTDNLTVTEQQVMIRNKFPTLDNYQTIDRLFKVNLDNSLTPSFAFYQIFDYQNRNDGNFRVSTNYDYVSCMVPKTFHGETVVPACTATLDGTWVKIMVAQSSFNGFTQSVTIRMGERKFVCGGDYRFFGLAGVAGKCDNYFTCYEGAIHDETLTITFSKDVDGSTCDFTALALIQTSNKAVPTQAQCTDKDPFVCEISGTCLTLNEVCDGITDCPDASDEGSCTNWNFVQSYTKPTCAPIMNTTELDSSAMCQRLALAKRATAFTYAANSGTKLCRVYDCLSFDNPQLSTWDGTAKDAEDSDLYVQTSDPDSFRYCTAALHCSNAGKPINSYPPCGCQCDTLYVGDRCDAVRNIFDIASVYVVFSDAVSVSSFTSAVLTAVAGAFQREVLQEDSLVIARTVLTLSDNKKAIKVGITTATGAQSEDVFNVMTLEARERMVEFIQLNAGTVGQDHLLFITASPVVGNKTTSFCNIASLSTDGTTCQHLPNISQAKSVTVTATSVSVEAASQWLRVETFATDPTSTSAASSALAAQEQRRQASAQATATASVLCDNTNFVKSVNPTLQGVCGISSECQLFLSNRPSAQFSTVTASPTWNPSGDTCQGKELESKVTIEGYIDLPDKITTDKVDFTSLPDESLLSGAIAMFVIGFLFCVLMVLFYWLIRPKWPEHFADEYAPHPSLKYIGSVSFCLFIICIFLGGVLYALYVGSEESSYTHLIVVEEYRDTACNNSELASLPIRISKAIVSGQCSMLAVVGPAQGAFFVAVRADSGDVTSVKIRSGGSESECEASEWKTLSLRTCMNQSSLFWQKDKLDLMYMSLLLVPTAVGNERLNIMKQYHPVPVPVAETTCGTAVLNERYDRFAGNVTYQFQNQFVTRPLPSSRFGNFYLVLNGSDVPQAVVLNKTHEQRVRFSAVYDGERIGGEPYLSNGMDGDFAPVGTFFNGYKSSSGLAAGSVQPYRDAMRLSGIAHKEWDIGLLDSRFTISFWISATEETRGFVVAVSDNWQSKSLSAAGSGGEIPPLSRLTDVLENGAETTSWYTDWVVSGGVYVHGPSKTIRYVSANLGGSPVDQVVWETRTLGVDRVFDGGWHFVALEFDRSENDVSVDAILVVDGETSYIKEGWRKCLPNHVPQRRYVDGREMQPGDTVKVLNARNEIVVNDGLLTIGHFNGGLYALNIAKSVLPLQTLAGMGAPGMEKFGNLEVEGSLALGIIIMLVALGIIFFSIWEIWHHYFGVDVNQLLLESETARKKDHNGRVMRDGFPEDVSTPVIIVIVHFITPTIGTAQNMALYFDGWAWPARVVDFYNVFYKLLVLDPFNSIEKFPTLLVPVVLFVLALAVLFGINVLAVQDEDNFQKVIKDYNDRCEVRDPFKWKHLEEGRPEPEYHWVVYDTENEPHPLEEEQERELVKELNHLLTRVEKRQQNARVHSDHMVKFPGIGDGILLYERRNGQIGVFFRVAPDPMEFYPPEKRPGGGGGGAAAGAASAGNSPRAAAAAHPASAVRSAADAVDNFDGTFSGTGTFMSSTGAGAGAAAGGGASSMSPREGGTGEGDANFHGTMTQSELGSTFDSTAMGATARRLRQQIRDPTQSGKRWTEGGANSTMGGGTTMGDTFTANNNTMLAQLAAGTFRSTINSTRSGGGGASSRNATPRNVASGASVSAAGSPGGNNNKNNRDGGDGAGGDEPNKLHITQLTLECRTDNFTCPLHGARLVRSALDGISCVHNDSPFYGSVACGSDYEMYQCTEPDCYYAVCEACFHDNRTGAVSSAMAGAMSAFAELKRKGIWKLLKAAVILSSLVLYLPVVRNAALVLFCHPIFLCEFGACWSKPSVVFIVFVFIAVFSIIFVGIGYIAQHIYLLKQRYDQLKDLLPVFPIHRRYCNHPWISWMLPQTNIMPKDYDRFLYVDDTLLKTLYEPHGFTMFWFTPAWLVSKACVIFALVGSTPNSLGQLAAVSTIEMIYSILVTALSPYKNRWVNTVARLSLLWMLLSLALMALHRVDIAQDIASEGMTDQMIALAIVFWVLVFFCVVFAVLEPWYDARQRSNLRIQELGDLTEEIEMEMAKKRELRETALEASKRG